MNNLRELNFDEMLDISGGSEKSYNNGVKFGKALRKAVDNAILVWGLLKGRIPKKI